MCEGFFLKCFESVCFWLNLSYGAETLSVPQNNRSSIVPQTAMTVLLLVTAFTICWMPHHIIAMWVVFGKFPLNEASFVFRIISHCLSYGNSCINPILYAFLSENFRQACRQVFSCHHLFSPPHKRKVICVRMDNFSSTHSSTNIWRQITWSKTWRLADMSRSIYTMRLFIILLLYDNDFN